MLLPGTSSNQSCCSHSASLVLSVFDCFSTPIGQRGCLHSLSPRLSLDCLGTEPSNPFDSIPVALASEASVSSLSAQLCFPFLLPGQQSEPSLPTSIPRFLPHARHERPSSSHTQGHSDPATAPSADSSIPRCSAHDVASLWCSSTKPRRHRLGHLAWKRCARAPFGPLPSRRPRFALLARCPAAPLHSHVPRA